MTIDRPCHIRTPRFLLGLAVLMLVNQVHALGLGELEVRSALDEPLIAEIEVTFAEKEALESLEIGLGSREDFNQAGVPRESFLQTLEFTVLKDGSPKIRITTTQPTKEPFLHFLVRAKWDDGNLLREYTALLDPPLYAPEQPAVISSPGLAEDLKAPASSGSATEVTQTEEVQSQQPGSFTTFGGAEYGPTEEGDTLWSIASRFDTSGYNVNVFQVMIALLRENPGAFTENNVNRMKTGQILRLPSLDLVSKEEATRVYQTQLEQWESYKSELAKNSEILKVPSGQSSAGVAESTATTETSTSSESAKASPDSAESPIAEEQPATEESPVTAESQLAEESSTTGETPETDIAVAEEPAESDTAATTGAAASEDPATTEGELSEQDLLKIVRATLDEEGEVSSAGTGAAVEAAQAEAEKEIGTLRGRISTLEESLVSTELQNKELQERIALLEDQVANAQRLIQLESEDLALAQEQAIRQQEEQELLQQQLQLTEQQDQQAEAEQQAAAAAAAAAKAEQEAAVKAQQEAAEQEAAVKAQQEAAEQEAAEKIEAEKAAAEQEADTVAGTAQLVPRNQESAPWWQNIVDVIVGSSLSTIAAVAGMLVLLVGALLFIRRRRSIAEFEESILSGSGLDGRTDSTENAASNSSGTDTSFLSDFGMAGMGSMQADEVDPLAEAEVYLAYGRDEQAEEVLKEAASRHPERHELKLKLLEIYQQRDDIKSFETLAEELYPAEGQGDPVAWGKVVEMGVKINPDNPLFSRELPSGPASTASVDEAIDADSFTGTSSVNETGLDADTDLIDLELPNLQAAQGMSDAELPQDIVNQSANPIDPSMNPFPQPDKNAGVTGEFDDLAEQMGLTTPTGSEPDVSDLAGQSKDAEMLNFSTTDADELDFDIDLEGPEAAPAKDTGVATDAPGTKNLNTVDIGEMELPDSSSQTADSTDDFSVDELSVDELSVVDGPVDEESRLQAEQSGSEMDGDKSPMGQSNDVTRNFGVVTGGSNQPERLPINDGEEDANTDNGKWDEAATKLDLAQAYLNMGDKAGARSIIDEVMKEGNPAQKDQAAELEAQLG